MTFPKSFLFTALPLCLIVACGGDKNSGGDGDVRTPSSSSSGKADSCESFCNGFGTCEGLSSVGCVETCSDGTGVSRGGQEVLANCLSADLCAPDATDLDGAASLACLTSGLDDLELSDAARVYCETSVDAINGCLGEPSEASPLGTCDDTIALASDEFLEGLNECATLSCDIVEACLSLEVFQNIPISELGSLEEGDDLPAGLIADILAVAVVAGQLGVAEGTGSVLTDSITGLLGGGDVSGGAAGAPSL